MIILLVGIIGMLFILTAFILDEFTEKFNRNSIRYNLTNLIGASLLSYYAFVLATWPFLILNLVWFVAAGVRLVMIIKK